ncbi:MAG: hypothetical protein AAFY56_02530 [Pseudomonadota bacterium]
MSTEINAGLSEAEIELQRFVDNDLDESGQERVAERLDERPGDAERVAAYQRHNGLFQMLRDGFEPGDDGGAVLELQRQLKKSLRRQYRRARMMRYAAGIAVFVVVGASGLWLSDQMPHDEVTVAAKPPMPSLPFGGFTLIDAPQAPSEEIERSIAWLEKQINQPLSAPRLEDYGLQLIGARILAAAQVPAVRLVYLDGSAKYLHLYVGLAGEPDNQAFPFVREGYLSINWQRQGLLFALTGPIESQELLAVMRSISESMMAIPEAPNDELLPPAENTPSPTLSDGPIQEIILDTEQNLGDGASNKLEQGNLVPGSMPDAADAELSKPEQL